MFRSFKLAALILCSASAVAAKTSFSENFSLYGAKEEWFMGASIGTQFYVGEFDRLQKAGYRFSTALEGSAGKWITPSIAVRMQCMLSRVTGGGIKGSRTLMNMVNLHIDLMGDIMNVIKGVDNERKFTVMPYIGAGTAINTGRKYSCFSLTAGAVALYRIDRNINLFADLKGTLLNEKFDGTTGGSPGEGSAVLSAGFIYKF